MNRGSDPPVRRRRPAKRVAPASGWRRAHGQPTTTLLLRHGQTALSAERRFAGRGDIPLTDLGLEQAAAAAARLAQRGDIDLRPDLAAAPGAADGRCGRSRRRRAAGRR